LFPFVKNDHISPHSAVIQNEDERRRPSDSIPIMALIRGIFARTKEKFTTDSLNPEVPMLT
jgi:hypothetical protein